MLDEALEGKSQMYRSRVFSPAWGVAPSSLLYVISMLILHRILIEEVMEEPGSTKGIGLGDISHPIPTGLCIHI